ncbi:MAG: DUF1217 domain-containing protein [Pseudomonadota bacterium]
MTFQPVVPLGGNAGWAFLQRTREAQQEAFEQSATIQRDTTYFRETIASVTTAEALMEDRRLLTVALGAFGLDDDINNTFFIRKVLEEGTLDPDSLANRLSDKRYLALAEAFGFGDQFPPNTVLSDFGTQITERFETRQFEVAIGTQNPDMRLALGLSDELSALNARGQSDDAAWFTIMATPPLRTVFERAFALPTSVGALDIDRQLEIFRDKAASLFGDSTVAQFADPERQDELVRLFLARSELQTAPSATVRGSAALAILQSTQPLF